MAGASQTLHTVSKIHKQRRLNIRVDYNCRCCSQATRTFCSPPTLDSPSFKRHNRFSQAHVTRGLQLLFESKVYICTARNILIKLYWQNIDNYILLGSILCVKIVANLTQTQKIINYLHSVKESLTETLTFLSISVHGIRSVLEDFFSPQFLHLILRGNFHWRVKSWHRAAWSHRDTLVKL